MAAKLERLMGATHEVAKLQDRIVASQTRDVGPFENGKQLEFEIDLADPTGNTKKLSHGLKRKPKGYIVTWQESIDDPPTFEPIYISVREASAQSITLGVDNDSASGNFRIKIWVY